MLGRKSLLAAGAVVAGLMLPSQAMAQYDAHTGADLNLRVGPGTEYGIIDVIPAGYPVDVLGCLDAYEWCDIEWDGLRGWVSARYLVQPGTTVYLPQYAPRIGVPIISFSFGTYHDRYYRDRPWYRERHGRWRGRDFRRGDRSRAREEVREEERREQRRDNREERVEDRREQRQERIEQRRDNRQERRQEQTEQRRENRQERQQRQQTEQPQESRQQRQQQRQETDQPRQRQQADQPRQGQRTQQRQKRRQPERQGRALGGQPE